MLFKYTVINQTGAEQAGTIDAVSEDSAITTLQRNGYVITRIESAEKKSGFNAPVGSWIGLKESDEFKTFNKYVYDRKYKRTASQAV